MLAPISGPGVCQTTGSKGRRRQHLFLKTDGQTFSTRRFLRAVHQLRQAGIAQLVQLGTLFPPDPTRSWPSDSLRQRPGADQSALSELVRGAKDPADPHSARSANAEWPRGEFQRPLAGRVLKCKLVSQSAGRAGQDQRLARGVQWRTAPQQSGLPDAQRVRGDPEILSYDWLKKTRQVT